MSDGPGLRPLHEAIGIEARGCDLSQGISSEELARLRDALARHSILLIRDQSLDAAAFASLMRSFGSLQRFQPMQAKPGRPQNRYSYADEPEIMKIGNWREAGKPAAMPTHGMQDWHIDEMYKPAPNAFTALFALVTPRHGGDTHFAGLAAAYDALDTETKDTICDLKGVYSVETLDRSFRVSDPERPPLWPETLRAHPPVAHPLVRRNPKTGRKNLFLSPSPLSHMKGMSAAESARLAKRLIKHATASAFQYRHKWRNGDLLIWDNCAVLHRATNYAADTDWRLLYRTMVTGTTLE